MTTLESAFETPPREAPKLVRGLGLKEATAANVVEMVGVGPFITIPFLISAMGGPQAMLGWLVGAVLAVCDGLVWAELGAAMPGAGGSYIYLREGYGANRAGQMMSFLFVWMILFTAPLSAATGAVGFAEYSRYLFPSMSHSATGWIAVCVVVAVTIACYRSTTSVGRLSFWLMLTVLGSILWVIISGIAKFKLSLLTSFPAHAFTPSMSFFWGLGQASLLAIYGYGGYNNVCYLGGEVKDPARNIPRAIIVSILLVAALYFCMTVSIIGVMPWREVALSPHVVSDFMQLIYGSWAAKVITILILGASFASVFALVLGLSRIPYAAAVDGQFFRVFGRLHPTGRFPHIAVASLGLSSTLFCFLNLGSIIQVLIVVQVIVLFLAQIVAVTLIRRRKDIHRPFQMWLYPLPSIAAASLWILVMVSTGWKIVAVGLAVLVVGVVFYMLRARSLGQWPFQRLSFDLGPIVRGEGQR